MSLVAVSLELLSDELLALEESCSAGLGSAGADGRVSATGLVGLGVVEAWLGLWVVVGRALLRLWSERGL